MITAAVGEGHGRARGAAGGSEHAGARPDGQRPATSNRSRPLISPLSEAALVRLWAGQRFPASALVTRQGVPLRVLHPGRPGRGAGPDFRDALIATPSGALLRGDVELHVRASHFQAHGHGEDQRYDGLVLHVVFEDDGAEDTPLASGRRAPVVALAPWVRRRARELAGWLAGPGLWREPCHDAVERLGEEHVLRTLDGLGEGRFRQRERALAASCAAEGPGAALARALLAGLGYGGDRRLFGELPDRLPWPELSRRLAVAPPDERVELAEALLLGAAGFLADGPGGRCEDPEVERLQERWRAAALPSAAAAPVSLRPANHPARRLAGLARLLVRHAALFEPGPAASFAGKPAELIAAWTVPADGSWRRWLAPGVPAARSPGALIGRSRAIELLANAVLPWAAAWAEARGARETAAQARAAFARLPRPGRYGALAFLEANLRPTGRRLPLDLRRQQGLLALYKMECTQGGCGRCAFS